VSLYIAFNNVQDFQKCVRYNDEDNSMEPKFSNHSKKKLIKVLSPEDLLEKLKEYVKIIRKDLKFSNKDIGFSSSRISALSEKTSARYGFKSKNYTYLSYLCPSSVLKRFKLSREGSESSFHLNEQNWEYWYLFSKNKKNKNYPVKIYIKVPAEVGDIFKQIKRKPLQIFCQPVCKKAILEDIQGEENNSVILRQLFGMNGETQALEKIRLCAPGKVLRIKLNEENFESLFKSGSLKGKNYTYRLTNTLKNPSIQVSGIKNLNALRPHKNEQLVKEEERNGENESSFQNSDDDLESVISQIVKEEAVKEEERNGENESSFQNSDDDLESVISQIVKEEAVKEEERNGENESSFQNSDDDSESVISQIVKEEAVKEEERNGENESSFQNSDDDSESVISQIVKEESVKEEECNGIIYRNLLEEDNN
jgi:hypothetical protein